MGQLYGPPLYIHTTGIDQPNQIIQFSHFIMIMLYISQGDPRLFLLFSYSSCVIGHNIFVNYSK
jgi:hypothetical protein